MQNDDIVDKKQTHKQEACLIVYEIYLYINLFVFYIPYARHTLIEIFQDCSN